MDSWNHCTCIQSSYKLPHYMRFIEQLVHVKQMYESCIRGHTTFEYCFGTPTYTTTNQSDVSNIYSVLIRRFCGKSTELVLDWYMTIRSSRYELSHMEHIKFRAWNNVSINVIIKQSVSLFDIMYLIYVVLFMCKIK